MAKARKKAAKKAPGKARKAPKGKAKKFKSSAVGVKRKAKRAKPVKKNQSIGERVVDAIKEAASLRTKLTGHDTFED